MGPPGGERWPTVTVVVVNLDGRDHLGECLRSVVDQDYPEGLVEVVVVDNASSDGSPDDVRRSFPQVQILTNPTNVGFAPAVNQAARVGRGEVLALLNNDAVAHPGWLRELVRPLSEDRVGCTGGLVLDARGESVDFAGGELSFYGHGFAAHRGEPPPQGLRARPTIFVTGASMATRRELFLDVGGFDPDYFAFFEDVDYGWRLWVLGHEVWFVPSAVATHRQHATVERFGYARERYLLERNALATVFKNYGDDLLSRTLPASVVLAMLRGLATEGCDLGDYRIGAAAAPDPDPDVPALTGAHLAALRDFGLSLERLRDKRAFVQSRRVRDDRDILPLFRRPVLPNVADAAFLAVFQACVDTFGLMWHTTVRQRVLIVTADTLGPRMAGPAIRVWEMARVLSAEHDVVLTSMRRPELSHDRFRVEHITAAGAAALAAWAEVIVVQGFVMHHFPEIAAADAAVVVDLYDPFHIEGLVMRRDEPPRERWATARSDQEVVNAQLRRGDLFLCASEKQRDFWLGHLTAVGRVNPATYDEDPGLRGLLEAVPFGLPADPPAPRRHAIRGVVEGIEEGDVVLLWGGGIYNWFDPATLIRAVAKAAADDPRVKLYFLGTAHPNPDVPAMARATEARRIAADLGLAGEHVFFNDGWTAYDERADYLCDADIGVSTHHLHLETELSFRTRLLDYLWAGLPILCTEGDGLSRFVADHDLGEVVPPGDVDAVAAAITRLTSPDRLEETRRNVAALAPQLTWERTLSPLVAFCRAPRRARDVDDGDPPYVRLAAGSRGRSPVVLARRFAAVTRDKGLSTAVRMAVGTLKLHREVAALRRAGRV